MTCSTRRLYALVALPLAGLLLAACGQAGAPASAAGVEGPASTGGVTGEVVVLAAASLAEAFTDIGTAFEAANPGTTVTFSFGGSAGLAEQIVSGAPADVFAAASTATMETAIAGLQEAGVDGADPLTPTVFATNSMVLAVPLANTAGVRELGDLDRDDVAFALCAAHAPCGAAADRIFGAAGLTVRPVTYEKDVTAVLVKVRNDEVDAGIVYATDVDESVGAVEIPAGVNTTTSYPILALPEAPNPDGAEAFTAFVLAPAGRAVLANHGFGAP